MADQPAKDIFQKAAATGAEIYDWIQENLGDPVLAEAIADDLGLKRGAPPPAEMDGATKKQIDDYKNSHDPDRLAFQQTIQELIQLEQTIMVFAEAAKEGELSAWDVVMLVGKLAAADTLRARFPLAFSLARLLTFISDDPEELATLEPGRLTQLLRGEGPPEGTGAAIAARISDDTSALLTAADALAGKFLGPGRFEAWYGWDPDPASANPAADLVSARTATLIFGGDPTDTLRPRVAVTLIGVPPEDQGPAIFLALSGALTVEQAIGASTYTFEVQAADALHMKIPLQKDVQFEIGSHVEASLKIGARKTDPSQGDPAIRLGQAGGTRLDIGAFSWGFDLAATHAGVRLGIQRGELVISLGDGDGFIGKLGAKISVPFELGVLIDTEHGFRLEGGTNVKVTLPVAATLFDVFTIEYLELGLGAGDKGGGVAVTVAGGFSLKLGPFAASVDRIGMMLDLSVLAAEGFEGLGKAFHFKPPNGLGMRLDAGVVRGGGYLYIDEKKGEYAGALELTIGPVSVKAIGILTTKMPDGSEGWALLLLVYGQFPPIQLSFGFTLSGLGGMIGLQHSADLDQLQAGMRTGVLDDILFPKDPVGDAPRIINRLRATFPPTARALIVGPMVEIGWGTPQVLTARLGIIIQLDNVLNAGGRPLSLSKVILIGQLQLQLPPAATGGPAVVKLLIDVVGFYDADKQWLMIRARLRDSKILILDLTGELLMSARFGDSPSFVLSVGGFHPDFHDIPEGVPKDLDRLGVGFSIGGIIKIGIWTYFAVTSNTVQMGMGASIKGDLGGIIRFQGEFSFDALIELQPTVHFTVKLRFSVSVSAFGFDLLSVDLRLTLSGPGLWHAVGTAKFHILFWDKEFSFDESWGESPEIAPVPTNVAQLMQLALSDPGNWTAQLPDGGRMMVTIGAIDPAPKELIAHPLGILEVRQNVAPLGLQLQRFGEGPIDGPSRFDVQSVSVGATTLAQPELMSEWFARGHFIEMTEEQRLAANSFELMPAGVRVGADEYAIPAGVEVGDMSFETFFLEPEKPARHLRVDLDLTRFSHDELLWQIQRGASAMSTRAEVDRLRSAPSLRIAVTPVPLAVAASGTLALAATLAGPAALAPAMAADVATGVAGGMVVEAFEIPGHP